MLVRGTDDEAKRLDASESTVENWVASDSEMLQRAASSYTS
jgi:hypothetical protein